MMAYRYFTLSHKSFFIGRQVQNPEITALGVPNESKISGIFGICVRGGLTNVKQTSGSYYSYQYQTHLEMKY